MDRGLRSRVGAVAKEGVAGPSVSVVDRGEAMVADGARVIAGVGGQRRGGAAVVAMLLVLAFVAHWPALIAPGPLAIARRMEVRLLAMRLGSTVQVALGGVYF